MRRRRRTKGDIIVDFTSLLDVIFIILMLVLAKQQVFESQSKEQLKQDKAEAESMKERSEKEYKLYEDQVNSAENMKEYICLLSVYCNYDLNDVTSRTINILNYDGNGVLEEPIELKGNDVNAGMNELEKILTDSIEDNQDKAIILSLNKDDDVILYRDEKRILEMFGGLSDTYENVVLK